MRSMDFEEFLWAKGYDSRTVESIYAHMADNRPFSDTEMQVFKALFLDYCILGGMPAVVRQYIESGIFSGTLENQEQIRLDYEEDITKYAAGLDKARILDVFRKIPVFLGKENKKFQISKVRSGARNREYIGTVDWLLNAGIVNACYCMSSPELPIKGNCNPEYYKLYFADTGLLIGALDDEAQEDLRANKLRNQDIKEG